ncbi:hypothetical protein [Streptomyces sp. NPDC051214]|uniref:hypothetical protein n=1 Tax=Streptomyces sp. NPDC051214 TaxID=3155282 RepID=UPI0034264CB9
MPNPLYEGESRAAALPLWILSVVAALVAGVSRVFEALLLLLPGKPKGSAERRRTAGLSRRELHATGE